MNLDILENSVQDVQKATKSGLLFMGITMIADGLTLISYPPSNMVGVIIVEQVLCWSTVFNMKEISLGLIINSIIPMQLRGLKETQA
jgi:hypothetical protein